MATMLRDKESTEKHLNTVRRHTRLCKQYENNYLDARKKLGRQTAEMLFPKSSGKKITIEDEG